MTHRVFNFSAGPATLPQSVLESAQRDLLDFGGTGTSVMEMSHRSAAYDEIHRGAIEALRRLLDVPDGYEVLFLQGGASLQFSMVPMNCMHPNRRADYVVTGNWSKKAVKEAEREGTVRIAATTEAEQFTRLPASDELDLDPGADYVHLTSNNTIFGTQWREAPGVGDVPLVADMSSDILCRPIDVSKYGLIYAGAQKNLGPAGVTLVIARQELIERAPTDLPTMLQYRTHAAKDSLFNTPPCWAIYIVGLACQWIEGLGGLPAMAERNRAKAEALYAAIDGTDFYRGTVSAESRSWMNVTFRLPTEELERRFVALAAERGLVNLKGYRTVGGVRASIYNAMPPEGVDALVELMSEFEQTHG